MDSGVRLQDVQQRARQGHRDWVFFTDRSGVSHAERYSRDAIKRAMLATGTRGRWLAIDSAGNGHLINWSLACLRLRNAKYFSA